MKIAHICLSCFYYDNFSYQENELVAQNIKDGHEVIVLASIDAHPKQSIKKELEIPYVGSDGAKAIRLPYRFGYINFLSKKLRAHLNVYNVLSNFGPDIIFFHGLCGWELMTVAKYVSFNSNVKFYIDSHSDFNNSARSFLSKYILHLLFYKPIARHASKLARKVFCISIEALNFAKYFYKLNERKLEFYPLGGKIFDDQQIDLARKNARDKLLLDHRHRLFVQTGKIDKKKKLVESLKAFKCIEGTNLRYIIAGNLEDDVKKEVENLIKIDNRIKYIGWVDPEVLRALLFAADIYVQPGSQSATMQMSLCCGCAVILDDVISHKPYVEGNGWLINDNLPLIDALKEAAFIKNTELSLMQKKSLKFARANLDYRKLASRIYGDQNYAF